MKNHQNLKSFQSNSVTATAFAVVVTSFIIGGYEVSQTVSHPDAAVVEHAGPAADSTAIAKMETIVVTARRG